MPLLALTSPLPRWNLSRLRPPLRLALSSASHAPSTLNKPSQLLLAIPSSTAVRPKMVRPLAFSSTSASPRRHRRARPRTTLPTTRGTTSSLLLLSLHPDPSPPRLGGTLSSATARRSRLTTMDGPAISLVASIVLRTCLPVCPDGTIPTGHGSNHLPRLNRLAARSIRDAASPLSTSSTA